MSVQQSSINTESTSSSESPRTVSSGQLSLDFGDFVLGAGALPVPAMATSSLLGSIPPSAEASEASTGSVALQLELV